MSEHYTKNEVQSGFLIFLGIITLLVLIFMTGSMQLFKQTYQIHIAFDYISGLAKNAPVHFAGHDVGKITEIVLLNQDDANVRVTITIDKNVVLKKDSQAYIDVMGFMGEKFIELTPGSKESARLLEHETLRGTDPVPLMEIVKRGTELLDEFEEISDSMNNLTADLAKIVGDNDQEIDGMIKNFNAISFNLNEMTRDLKYHPWKLVRKGKERKLPPLEPPTSQKETIQDAPADPVQETMIAQASNDDETPKRKKRLLIF